MICRSSPVASGSFSLFPCSASTYLNVAQALSMKIGGRSLSNLPPLPPPCLQVICLEGSSGQALTEQ